MKLNPESIARASSRHPWRTVGLWFVLIMSMGYLSSNLLADVLSQDIEFTNEPESVRAQNLLERSFPGSEQSNDTVFFIVGSPTSDVADPGFQARVTQLTEGISALGPDVIAGPPVSYVGLPPEQTQGLVAQSGHYALVPVQLKDNTEALVEQVREVAREATGDGVDVLVAGNPALFADFTKIAEEDLRRGEGIGLAIALVVLIVVFGALVAALLPIVMAIFAIVAALGLVALIGQLVDFNLFVTNMISMIGLAVGIDYSLFIVSRYREERKKGRDKLEAIGHSGATANRAVFFSGMTVVLALLGMFIIPTTIFRSLAGGAILVTLAAIAASMTLLPAMLGLLGDRINWPRLSKRARVDSEPDPKGGAWDRLARSVMARPVIFLIAGVLILGTLGSFYFQLHRGTSQNVSQLPDDFESKLAFVTLQQEFAGGTTDPVQIVISGDVASSEAQAAVAELQQAVAQDPAFAEQTTVQPSEDGSVLLVQAFFRGDPSSDASFKGVRDLRAEIVPAAFGQVENVDVAVGGNTAFFTDFLDVANRYQWIVLAFVLGLSFVLLTVVFRSIVVPIKAIILNLLSVAAAYGAVTLVFQKGVGISIFNDILQFQFVRVEAIEAWLPLFLFSVLFGLSMDYEVFLLTRIREEYDRTHDNTEAVAYGLRTTAGIITGAAIIMVAVFTAFASGRLGPLQQMGFGLAVAVFLDATIVRTILVPSTMRLLGDVNWYLPRWLEWLPKLNVEGHVDAEEALAIPEVETVGAREDG
ncbi:MAG TPA: MMPL family transporter [Actinomycetota bacterium]|nr:MMPL family transporter [Actinomycetota bacterium]